MNRLMLAANLFWFPLVRSACTKSILFIEFTEKQYDTVGAESSVLPIQKRLHELHDDEESSCRIRAAVVTPGPGSSGTPRWYERVIQETHDFVFLVGSGYRKAKPFKSSVDKLSTSIRDTIRDQSNQTASVMDITFVVIRDGETGTGLYTPERGGWEIKYNEIEGNTAIRDANGVLTPFPGTPLLTDSRIVGRLVSTGYFRQFLDEVYGVSDIDNASSSSFHESALASLSHDIENFIGCWLPLSLSESAIYDVDCHAYNNAAYRYDSSVFRIGVPREPKTAYKVLKSLDQLFLGSLGSLEYRKVLDEMEMRDGAKSRAFTSNLELDPYAELLLELDLYAYGHLSIRSGLQPRSDDNVTTSSSSVTVSSIVLPPQSKTVVIRLTDDVNKRKSGKAENIGYRQREEFTLSTRIAWKYMVENACFVFDNSGWDKRERKIVRKSKRNCREENPESVTTSLNVRHFARLGLVASTAAVCTTVFSMKRVEGARNSLTEEYNALSKLYRSCWNTLRKRVSPFPNGTLTDEQRAGDPEAGELPHVFAITNALEFWEKHGRHLFLDKGEMNERMKGYAPQLYYEYTNATVSTKGGRGCHQFFANDARKRRVAFFTGGTTNSIAKPIRSGLDRSSTREKESHTKLGAISDSKDLLDCIKFSFSDGNGLKRQFNFAPFGEHLADVWGVGSRTGSDKGSSGGAPATHGGEGFDTTSPTKGSSSRQREALQAQALLALKIYNNDNAQLFWRLKEVQQWFFESYFDDDGHKMPESRRNRYDPPIFQHIFSSQNRGLRVMKSNSKLREGRQGKKNIMQVSKEYSQVAAKTEVSTRGDASMVEPQKDDVGAMLIHQIAEYNDVFKGLAFMFPATKQALQILMFRKIAKWWKAMERQYFTRENILSAYGIRPNPETGRFNFEDIRAIIDKAKKERAKMTDEVKQTRMTDAESVQESPFANEYSLASLDDVASLDDDDIRKLVDSDVPLRVKHHVALPQGNINDYIRGSTSLLNEGDSEFQSRWEWDSDIVFVVERVFEDPEKTGIRDTGRGSSPTGTQSPDLSVQHAYRGKPASMARRKEMTDGMISQTITAHTEIGREVHQESHHMNSDFQDGNFSPAWVGNYYRSFLANGIFTDPTYFVTHGYHILPNSGLLVHCLDIWPEIKKYSTAKLEREFIRMEYFGVEVLSRRSAAISYISQYWMSHKVTHNSNLVHCNNIIVDGKSNNIVVDGKSGPFDINNNITMYHTSCMRNCYQDAECDSAQMRVPTQSTTSTKKENFLAYHSSIKENSAFPPATQMSSEMSMQKKLSPIIRPELADALPGVPSHEVGFDDLMNMLLIESFRLTSYISYWGIRKVQGGIAFNKSQWILATIMKQFKRPLFLLLWFDQVVIEAIRERVMAIAFAEDEFVVVTTKRDMFKDLCSSNLSQEGKVSINKPSSRFLDSFIEMSVKKDSSRFVQVQLTSGRDEWFPESHRHLEASHIDFALQLSNKRGTKVDVANHPSGIAGNFPNDTSESVASNLMKTCGLETFELYSPPIESQHSFIQLASTIFVLDFVEKNSNEENRIVSEAKETLVSLISEAEGAVRKSVCGIANIGELEAKVSTAKIYDSLFNHLLTVLSGKKSMVPATGIASNADRLLPLVRNFLSFLGLVAYGIFFGGAESSKVEYPDILRGLSNRMEHSLRRGFPSALELKNLPQAIKSLNQVIRGLEFGLRTVILTTTTSPDEAPKVVSDDASGASLVEAALDNASMPTVRDLKLATLRSMTLVLQMVKVGVTLMTAFRDNEMYHVPPYMDAKLIESIDHGLFQQLDTLILKFQNRLREQMQVEEKNYYEAKGREMDGEASDSLNKTVTEIKSDSKETVPKLLLVSFREYDWIGNLRQDIVHGRLPRVREECEGYTEAKYTTTNSFLYDCEALRKAFYYHKDVDIISPQDGEKEKAFLERLSKELHGYVREKSTSTRLPSSMDPKDLGVYVLVLGPHMKTNNAAGASTTMEGAPITESPFPIVPLLAFLEDYLSSFHFPSWQFDNIIMMENHLTMHSRKYPPRFKNTSLGMEQQYILINERRSAVPRENVRKSKTPERLRISQGFHRAMDRAYQKWGRRNFFQTSSETSEIGSSTIDVAGFAIYGKAGPNWRSKTNPYYNPQRNETRESFQVPIRKLVEGGDSTVESHSNANKIGDGETSSRTAVHMDVRTDLQTDLKDAWITYDMGFKTAPKVRLADQWILGDTTSGTRILPGNVLLEFVEEYKSKKIRRPSSEPSLPPAAASISSSSPSSSTTSSSPSATGASSSVLFRHMDRFLKSKKAKVYTWLNPFPTGRLMQVQRHFWDMHESTYKSFGNDRCRTTHATRAWPETRLPPDNTRKFLDIPTEDAEILNWFSPEEDYYKVG